MAKLTEFLRDGRLGPVEIGCNRAAVTGALGNPDAISDPRGRDAVAILKFGSLQVSLQRDRTILIALYFDDELFILPNAVALEDFEAQLPISRVAVEEWLQAQGIEPRPSELSFTDRPAFKAPSGAEILFEEDHLQSIQLYRSIDGS